MARSSVKVDFKVKDLMQKQQRAFVAANQDLKEEIIGEIASPVWDWGGTTVRQTGEIAGSPRNIIDSGDLLDSYQEPKMQGRNACIHQFTADYVLAVHNGAVYSDNRTLQPRPFTERPVANFANNFARRYREES